MCTYPLQSIGSKNLGIMLGEDLLTRIFLNPPFGQSSNTSAFLLHEVAKQPELQEKMYKEVCTILGDRNSPSFDDLQKMTLVRGCVKEILR